MSRNFRADLAAKLLAALERQTDAQCVSLRQQLLEQGASEEDVAWNVEAFRTMREASIRATLPDALDQVEQAARDFAAEETP